MGQTVPGRARRASHYAAPGSRGVPADRERPPPLRNATTITDWAMRDLPSHRRSLELVQFKSRRVQKSPHRKACERPSIDDSAFGT